MAVMIDELEVKIQDNAEQAAAGIDALTASLARLRSATHGGGGLGTTAKNISNVADAVARVRDSSGLTQLSDGLTKLRDVGKLNLTGTVNQLEKVPSAVAGLKALDFSDTTGLEAMTRNLVAAVAPLQAIEKTNLGPTLNQLKKIPDIMDDLDAADLDRFANQMERVATAVRPLADEMAKVAAGFSAFPSRIQRLITQNDKLSASNVKTAKSYGVLGTGIKGSTINMAAMLIVTRRLGSAMGEWLNESNQFVENLNLFDVSMGKFADEARRYAETVQDIMGIDMSEWIRNQGVFMQIATGFGIIEDKAYTMSKGLTQIGYDIASFYNIKIEDSMQKVQSGIAGELEPLRRLGYALDQATLQQVAFNHGIDMSVQKMTQAQKSQLRYIAIMEQSKNIMGDMGRTLITPANALRVLDQQFTQLKRAAGDVVSVIATQLIPWVQAFVIVLTDAARALAALLGFSLPEIDYSGMNGLASGAEDLEDNLSGAGSAAKKLKNTLAGFDQINLIQSASGGGGGGGALSGIFDNLDLSAWDYDFLGNISNNAKELAEKIKDALDWALLLGAAIGAWKLAEAVKNMGTLGKLLASAAVIALEFVVVKKFTDDFFKSGEIGDLIKALIATAIGSGFLYALWGPAGLAVGIGVGVVAMLTSMYFNIKDGTAQVGDMKTKVVSAIVTTLSGIAGMVVAAKAGASIGAGGLIGLTVGASLSLVVQNMAAVAGGQYSAGGLESGLMALISTAFLAVGGLVTLGPAGLAIGIAVGIVLNIISLSFAVQEQIKQSAIDTFFDGQGETLDRLAESYNSLMRSIVDTNQPIINAWQSIADGKESIQGATDNILNLKTQIDMGVLSAEEGLPRVTEAFQSLYDETGSLLTNLANNIYTALAGSTGEGLAGAGFNLDELGRIIKSTTETAQQDLDTLKQANNELMEAIKSGSADAGAWDKLIENAARISEIAGTSKPEIAGFSDALRDIVPKDIDWETIENAGEIFTNMAAATDAAKTSITESSDAMIQQFDEIKRLATEYNLPAEDVKILDGIIDYLKTDKDGKLAEIDAVLAGFLGTIQADLISGMQDQVGVAFENWDAMGVIDQLFAGGAEHVYVAGAIATFKNNVIDPISSKLTDAFGKDFGADAAKQAAQDVINTLYVEMGNIGMEKKDSSNVEKNIKAVIDAAIKDLPNYAKEAFRPSGKSGGEGLIEGAKSTIEDVKATGTGIVDALLGSVDAAAGINSPATTMIDRGLYLEKGFEKGITDNAHLPIAAMKTTLSEVNNVFKTYDFSTGINNMFNQMLSGLETFTNRFQGGVKTMLDNVSKAMNSVQSSSGGAVSVPSMGKISIPRFASGGFPEDGLFFANSRELVGKFANGKTAVANNETITEGFRRAVAEGEAKNNELTQEQNALLREILKALTTQGGGGSDVEAGRALKRLLSNYDAMTGSI